MKKFLLAAVLGLALTFCGAAAAEEYIMTPGDQLQIYVLGHEDLSTRRNTSDTTSSYYVVRPDGKLDFPLIGTIDTTGKTIPEFTQELKEKLSEYIIDPTSSFRSTNPARETDFMFYVFIAGIFLGNFNSFRNKLCSY